MAAQTKQEETEAELEGDGTHLQWGGFPPLFSILQKFAGRRHFARLPVFQRGKSTMPTLRFNQDTFTD